VKRVSVCISFSAVPGDAWWVRNTSANVPWRRHSEQPPVVQESDGWNRLSRDQAFAESGYFGDPQLTN